MRPRLGKLGALGAGGLLAAALAHFLLVRDLPSASEIIAAKPAASGLLLDRHGELLFRFFDSQDRVPVSIEVVPDHLIEAIIAIEDREFYKHHGASLAGITRALRNNLRQGAIVEGGSTITQQLIKNRVVGPARSFTRKYRELVLALALERRLSKRQILELYLNQVPWGGSAHGIEAAALTYFDKPASQLSLSESAFLAGLLRAPSRYSPFRRGSTDHLHRRRLVLNLMAEQNRITGQQRLEALEEKLAFAPYRVRMPAPHFTLYVQQLLEKKLGRESLTRRGLRIRSSLNLALHKPVQEIVSSEVRRMFRHRVSNGAALVTDPATGDILSMVGSVDFFDKAIDGEVNLTLSLRQPGSAIKPLTYAMVLQRGKTASTLVSDEPMELEIPDEGNYAPRNIDFEFRGTLTLREALAASRNVPAVNQLLEIGVPAYVAKARQLGINSWEDQTEYRYALTLGSGEVRMIDLAGVFSAFPNLGMAVRPDPILSIADRQGRMIYEKACENAGSPCAPQPAFSSGVAFMINSILSDDRARAPTFGRNSDMVVPKHQVAVKSGTTDLLRDNWAIGYTTDVLAAVWIGNNDGAPMRVIHSGSYGASTIWNKIMRRLLLTKPEHRFPVPDDIIREPRCTFGARGQCEQCTGQEEYYVRGTQPSQSCPAMASLARGTMPKLSAASR